ncbi:MAG: c-type cytochrome [Gillisia sp.]
MFWIFLLGSFLLPPMFLSAVNAHSFFQKQNTRPTVKILESTEGKTYEKESRVVFKVQVSDKEDGESKYDEISPNRVLLKLEYLPSEKKKTLSRTSGLVDILNSNCINCHSFEGKRIGPSFYEINQHSQKEGVNVQEMVKRVKNGSSGIWGKAMMPAHPELSTEEIQRMISWINNPNTFQNTYYFTGIEGSVLLSPLEKGDFTSVRIIASYTDNGIDNENRMQGQDTIVIHLK